MELTINERIHLLSLLLGEVQRLEADLQIETTPAIAKLQRETYDESREIYHKLIKNTSYCLEYSRQSRNSRRE